MNPQAIEAKAGAGAGVPGLSSRPRSGLRQHGSALHSVQHDASPNALIGRTLSQLVDRAATSSERCAPGPNIRTK